MSAARRTPSRMASMTSLAMTMPYLSEDTDATLVHSGYASQILHILEWVGVHHEQVRILASSEGADDIGQAAQPRRVARDNLQRLHWRQSRQPRQMHVVLQVPKFGVKRTRVTAKTHALDQPQVTQRADHRQKMIEVALEFSQLLRFGAAQL